LSKDGWREQGFQTFLNNFIVRTRAVSPTHMIGIAGLG
jgi:hypothetical protein